LYVRLLNSYEELPSGRIPPNVSSRVARPRPFKSSKPNNSIWQRLASSTQPLIVPPKLNGTVRERSDGPVGNMTEVALRANAPKKFTLLKVVPLRVAVPIPKLVAKNRLLRFIN